MRIRKRQVPLPLSSLSPVPLSDPLFLGHDGLPPVQLQLLPAARPPPRAFDSQDPCPIPSAAGDSDRLQEDGLPADYFQGLRDGEARGVSEKISSYNHSRADPDNPERSTSGLFPSAVSASLPHEAHATPLKKRRLSPRGDVDGDENKMETKTKASSNGGRRRGRGGGAGSGGTIMEGSRCSRVNGRGWRCGQQTLVGYSLCQHHLGKGRLRSMMNVRSHPMISAMAKGNEKLEAAHYPTGTDPERFLPSGLKKGNSLTYNNEEEDYNDEEDDSEANGKKKARSMSSLLQKGPNHGDNAGTSALSYAVKGRDLSI